MSFQERLALSTGFEQQVIEWLRKMGWQAFPFGQALLPPDCRDGLKRFIDAAKRPSLIRWMPDIFTFRDFAGGRSSVALIDAKYCADDRPNYAIELAAIETAEIFVDRLFTPTYFIFNDMRGLTPRDARMRGYPMSTAPGGSGTPFVLVNKQFGTPIKEWFWPPPPRAVQR